MIDHFELECDLLIKDGLNSWYLQLLTLTLIFGQIMFYISKEKERKKITNEGPRKNESNKKVFLRILFPKSGIPKSKSPNYPTQPHKAIFFIYSF